MAGEERQEETATPVRRLVTPSLAELDSARLAEVVDTYRRQLQHLAGQAHHCCAWALEAIDTLVGDNVQLRRQLERPAVPEPLNTTAAENPTAVLPSADKRRRRRP
jgi:hypothetical protein